MASDQGSVLLRFPAAAPGPFLPQRPSAQTFHGAARGRALVVFAGPLVVALREVVHHPGADLVLTRIHRTRGKEIVGDRGEAESGACAFGALIEHRHLVLAIVGEPSLRRDLDERRDVHLIPEVEGVAARDELSAGEGAKRTAASGRHDGVLTAWVTTGGMARRPASADEPNVRFVLAAARWMNIRLTIRAL
jgi:hypothetical protein